MEDGAAKVSFKDLAEQEVKTHKGRGGPLRWLLVLMVFLLVAGLAGWYLYPLLMTDRPSAQVEEVQVEKRMAMPLRTSPPQESDTEKTPDDALVTVPSETPADVPAEMSEASIEAIPETVGEVATESVDSSEDVQIPSVSVERSAEETSVAVGDDEPLYRVQVGPIVSNDEVERVTTLLIDKGFRPQLQSGSGTVDMIRLLEGIYPLEQAQERLDELQAEFPAAFLLPDGNRWALYIGSFSDRERARRQQRALAERQIQVAQVDSQLTMSGTLLIIAHADEKTAEGIAAEIRSSGLRVRIEIKR